MKSNNNIEETFGRIIYSSEPLADWFKRNKDALMNSGLSYDNFSLFVKNPNLSQDVKTLGKMFSLCLNWLGNTDYYEEDRAHMAIVTIAQIYEMDKEKISDYAKEAYKIDHRKLDERGPVIITTKR